MSTNLPDTEINLADVRTLSPVHSADLAWFYGDSDGELGLQSNYARMAAAIEAGGPRKQSSRRPPPDTGYADRMAEAASRARLVSRTLERISAEHRATLWAAYGEPVEGLEAWRELAGVVARLESARAAHVASRSKRPFPEWLARLARPSASAEARLLRGKLEREAFGQLAAAGRAFVWAWKQVHLEVGARAEMRVAERRKWWRERRQEPPAAFEEARP